MGDIVPSEVLSWLRAEADWISYRAALDLEGSLPGQADVQALKNGLLQDPRFLSFIEELDQWPGPVLKSHKNAKLLIHKLNFLTEAGFRAEDSLFAPILEKVLSHQSDEGPFQILINIPKVFGGDNTDKMTWVLSDAPIVVHALAQAGLRDDPRVKKGVEFLSSLVQKNGWPCAAAPELGRFKGPGKRIDPCPYATLLMVRLLSLYPEYHDSEEIRFGIDCLLDLWERRKETRPFLFGMGTDFAKLKAPFVWYDILHVCEALSRFREVWKDSRFLEMIEIVRSKEDEGRYRADSIYLAMKAFDFGQKKVPSRWITFLVYRILARQP